MEDSKKIMPKPSFKYSLSTTIVAHLFQVILQYTAFRLGQRWQLILAQAGWRVYLIAVQIH